MQSCTPQTCERVGVVVAEGGVADAERAVLRRRDADDVVSRNNDPVLLRRQRLLVAVARCVLRKHEIEGCQGNENHLFAAMAVFTTTLEAEISTEHEVVERRPFQTHD